MQNYRNRAQMERDIRLTEVRKVLHKICGQIVTDPEVWCERGKNLKYQFMLGLHFNLM